MASSVLVIDTDTLIAKKIDDQLNEWHRKSLFNGNILVKKNERLIYKGSFGFADKSKKLTDKSKFGIGSVYKEFPAVAIMQLVERNLIHLEDHISKYIPNLPKWGEKIRVKHLLQYTSGLPKIDFGKYFAANHTIGTSNLKQDILDIENLEFEPGSDYLYSNNNPILLMQLVERISGQDFEGYVKDKLFTPNQLVDSEFMAAYPYRDNLNIAWPMNADFVEDNYRINVPALLLVTTTSDLNNWLRNLHSYKIINRESLLYLTQTAPVQKEGLQAPLGNCTILNRSITTHSHHGSSGNYESLIQYDQEEKLKIIILTNQKNGNVFDISERIKEIINYQE